MPCYEQRIVSVKLAAMDLSILKPALEAAGFKLTEYGQGSNTLFQAVSKKGQWAEVVVVNGERAIRTTQGMEAIIDEIKQAYAFGVVQEVTKYGWDVAVDGNQITLGQTGGDSTW